MNHRPISVIAVVALVVLAGCSGLVPGGNSAGNGTTATQTTQPTATDTSTQTTTTTAGEASTTASMTAVPTASSTTGMAQTATSTTTGTTQMATTGTTQTTQTTTGSGTQSGMYPPGYAASGITNPQRAIEHHRAALSASGSYTLTLILNTTKRQFFLVRHINLVNKRAYTTLNATLRSGFGVSIARYQNATTRYTKTSLPLSNKSRYTVTQQPFAFNGSNKSAGRATLLSNVSFGGAEQVTHNGTTLLRYESTELQNAKPFLPLLATNATVNEFNATILVTKEGIIRSLSYSITYTTASGKQKTTAITARLSRIGTTSVEEPAWLDEAKAQTNQSAGTPGTAGNATTTSSG